MKCEKFDVRPVKEISRYSKTLSFFYNVIRWIPNIFFGIIYFIIYGFKVLIHKDIYRSNKERWLKIYNENASLEDIIDFFYNIYSYKWDGLRGVFDHDSSILEWVYAFGDCDDRALYLKKCLRKIGIPAIRIGLKGKNATSMHYEVLFTILDQKTQRNQYCMLFRNEILKSDTVEGVLTEFGRRWSNYKYDIASYCVSLY